MRQFIRMGEYQIEVSYGYHVRERLMARFTDIDIPYFNFILIHNYYILTYTNFVNKIVRNSRIREYVRENKIKIRDIK